MVAEFFYSLFDFQIIVLIVFTLISGFRLGSSQFRFIGVVIWASIIIFFQAILFFTSDWFLIMLYNGQPRNLVLIIMHLAMHPAILLLWIRLGRIQRNRQKALLETARLLTSSQLVSKFNVLGNHPLLANAGWFAMRWNTMNETHRTQWVEDNMKNLQQLWLEADGGKFEEFFGLNTFSMRLAEIEETAEPDHTHASSAPNMAAQVAKTVSYSRNVKEETPRIVIGVPEIKSHAPKIEAHVPKGPPDTSESAERGIKGVISGVGKLIAPLVLIVVISVSLFSNFFSDKAKIQSCYEVLVESSRGTYLYTEFNTGLTTVNNAKSITIISDETSKIDGRTLHTYQYTIDGKSTRVMCIL